MKCPYCGYENHDNAERCEKCCAGFPMKTEKKEQKPKRTTAPAKK